MNYIDIDDEIENVDDEIENVDDEIENMDDEIENVDDEIENMDEYIKFIELAKIIDLNKYINISNYINYDDTFIELPYNQFIKHEFMYDYKTYKYLTINDIDIIQMYYSAPLLYYPLLNLLKYNQKYFTVNEYGLIGIYQKTTKRIVLYKFNEKCKNVKFNIWMPANSNFIRLYPTDDKIIDEFKNYIHCNKPDRNYFITSFLNMNKINIKSISLDEKYQITANDTLKDEIIHKDFKIIKDEYGNSFGNIKEYKIFNNLNRISNLND